MALAPTYPPGTPIRPLLPPRYLLDTNILLAYAREDERFHKIEAHYGLLALSTSEAPLVSVVNVAEVRAMAQANKWGSTRTAKLTSLLARFPSVPIERPELLDNYVRISAFCQERGFGIGQNDMWIAATAMMSGAILLTTDKDFDPLVVLSLQREWIDPNTRP